MHISSGEPKIAAMVDSFDADELSPAVIAARDQIQNPRLLSDRIAMGRALWRDLVVGFAAQIPQLGTRFLAARRPLRGRRRGDADDRGPRRADRPLAVRHQPPGGLAREARPRSKRTRRSPIVGSERSRSRPKVAALLAEIDTARAAQFLSVVRPLPPGERALVAMGVAALSRRAITRRGRLIKSRS